MVRSSSAFDSRDNVVTHASTSPIPVVLAVDAITPFPAGIGRYTGELLHRLGQCPDLVALESFWHWRFLSPEQAQGLQRPSVYGRLAHSPESLTHRLLRRTFEVVAPSLQAWALRKRRTAVFHSPNFFLPPHPGPKVVTIHDLSVWRNPQWHPPARLTHIRRHLPKSIAMADVIIVPSHAVFSDLLEHFPEARAKQICVIHLGVNPCDRATSAETERATLAGFDLGSHSYALCVATVEPRKNLQRLVEAYSRLSPTLAKSCPLVLVGGQGWGNALDRAAASKAMQEGWLRMAGYVSEPTREVLLRNARCFVFPSLDEGFGLPVLEALAAGVPTLAADIPVMRELVGGYALLADPYSVDGLRDALGVLLESDEPARQAEAASSKITERFRWEGAINKTIDAYRLAFAVR